MEIAEYNNRIEILRYQQLQLLSNNYSNECRIINDNAYMEAQGIEGMRQSQIALCSSQLVEEKAGLESQRKAENSRIEAGTAQVIKNIESQKQPIKDDFELACQKAYISKMESIKNYPQKIRAQGYNGGENETLSKNVEVTYQQNILKITTEYNQKLQEIEDKKTQAVSDGNLSLQENNQHFDKLIADAETRVNAEKIQINREYSGMAKDSEMRRQSSLNAAYLNYYNSAYSCDMQFNNMIIR